MFENAHQRAKKLLSTPHTAVLATCGPAGVQAGEFPCQAIDLVLYLLVPKTSDHLFNLEHEPDVSLLTPGWEMKGHAQIIPPESSNLKSDLFLDEHAQWCVLVRVNPTTLQIRNNKGWGNQESIDLKTG